MYSLIKYKNISIQLVYIGGVAWFLGLFFFKWETENTWFAIQMSTACCAYDRVHRALEIVSFNGLLVLILTQVFMKLILNVSSFKMRQ